MAFGLRVPGDDGVKKEFAIEPAKGVVPAKGECTVQVDLMPQYSKLFVVVFVVLFLIEPATMRILLWM